MRSPSTLSTSRLVARTCNCEQPRSKASTRAASRRRGVAAVEHEQQPAALERGDQPVGRTTFGGAEVERDRNRRCDEFRRGDRGEVDETDSIGERRPRERRDLHGDPGLADAAAAG